MQTLQDRPIRILDDPAYKHFWRLFIWVINLRLVPFWQERFRDPLTVPFRYLFYDGLTRTGKALLLVALWINFGSYIHATNYPMSGASLLVLLLVVNYLVSRSASPNVAIERRAPLIATAGETFSSNITLTNLSTRTLKNFSIREMKGMPVIWPTESELHYRASLPPQETTTMQCKWTPRRRGVIHLWGIAVQSYFPLFLGRNLQRLKAQHSVYVLPFAFNHQVPSLRRLAAATNRDSEAGFANGQYRQSHEYIDSRTFMMGDSLNRIDHKASARRGELMTRLYGGSQVAPSAEVHLICDLSLAGFAPWQPRPRNPEVLDRRLAAMVAIYQRAITEKLTLGYWMVGESWGTHGDEIEFFKQLTVVAPTRNFTVSDQLPAGNGVYCLVIGRWREELLEQIQRWQAQGATILVFMLPESKQEVGKLPPQAGWTEFPGP
ncbi:MAG TPA: hypothetical protein DCZ03_12710 [Gammaproteobacteria bacterium]|nr:hypothetical protein [Gammaproteobacteria bacterium]